MTGGPRYLHSTLRRQPISGRISVWTSLSVGIVLLVVLESRCVRAPSRSTPDSTVNYRRIHIRLNAVLAEEIGFRRGDHVRWLLLTTHPIESFKHALSVVRGYTMRWRIEEFHRAWKRGLCNVETRQLHRRNAIIKWATVLATVAARAVRLAYLLRSSPEQPASTEFTEYEIDAAFILTKLKRDRRKQVTLRQVIDMIAEIGGFAHKYSGGFLRSHRARTRARSRSSARHWT